MTTQLDNRRRGQGCPVARPFGRPIAETSTSTFPRDCAAHGLSWERTTPPLAECSAADQLGARDTLATPHDRGRS